MTKSLYKLGIAKNKLNRQIFILGKATGNKLFTTLYDTTVNEFFLNFHFKSFMLLYVNTTDF